MSLWGWIAIAGVCLAVAGVLYIRIKWWRSPLAYRALTMIGVGYFISGVMLGAWVMHLNTTQPNAPTVAAISPCTNCSTPVGVPSAALPWVHEHGFDPVHAVRPDPKLTPGEVFPNVTKEDVCTNGWASAHRWVTQAQREQAFAEYHRTGGVAGCCELDHLIPLELGGSNDIRNLWPQPDEPAPGYSEKDKLENTLHGLVCTGALSLAEAQRCIATDWVGCWEKYQALR